jgi:outer membrane protein OmpA-like peptidoglycan-associated protein
MEYSADPSSPQPRSPVDLKTDRYSSLDGLAALLQELQLLDAERPSHQAPKTEESAATIDALTQSPRLPLPPLPSESNQGSAVADNHFSSPPLKREPNNPADRTGTESSVRSMPALITNPLPPSSNASLPASSINTTDELRQSVSRLDAKLTQLEQQLYQPTDLINPILPLITELLQIKANESRESILQAVIPVIDEVIQQRAQQDQSKMATALSSILPSAIAVEIKNTPEAIARAIAPELAIAMQEQIRLNPHSMSTALGPEMGKAIKTQINLEPDAMVDALYPVIGNTIAKYMAEVVQDINEKVENTLSVQGVVRKIRAKLKGISEAELIVQESLGFAIRAVFLIHKASGLVIYEVQPDSKFKLEADMVAGMLTAIRSFVKDCVSEPGVISELHEIDYDDSKIILEVAGYCYLTAVIKGKPSKEFISNIRATLGQIVLKYDELIQTFTGDTEHLPELLKLLLDQLVLTETQKPRGKPKPPIALLGLLLLLGLPIGYWFYRAHIAQQIESDAAIALDAAPELSVYRLIPDVQGDQLVLTGRVPSQYLRTKAGQVVSAVAPTLKLNNQVIAVKVPTDPEQIIREVQRLTQMLNQQPGVALFATLQEGTVTLKGLLPDLKQVSAIVQSYRQLSGVDAVISFIQINPLLDTRIFFDLNSSQASSVDTARIAKLVQALLQEYPNLHLRIIGHSDETGQAERNQILGLERARFVQRIFVNQNINPKRLILSSSSSPPPNLTVNQPLHLSRCVRFEPFVPR